MFGGRENIKVELQEVTKINSQAQAVACESGDSFSYDVLLVATGSRVNYFGISGMDKHAEAMTTISQTVQLRAKIFELLNGTKQTPKIAIIGAGPSGVELAGEINNLAKSLASKSKSMPKTPKVTIIEGQNRVLPILSEKVSSKSLDRLHKLGVEVILNAKVMSCEPGKLCVDVGDINADLIVWTAGTRPAEFVAAHSDIFEFGRGGKIVVNEFLQTKDPHIFALGDNAITTYSGMAQTAIFDGNFVAGNLILMQNGKQMMSYGATPPVYVVPIGNGWAIYQKGESIRSGRVGWLVRRSADKAIFEQFLPYKNALIRYKSGNKSAKLIK
jgi:NADH:ubiquinone reductase (H+-translocating)